MGIRSMIVYFWYVPKGYRKQHFHSLIAILKIGILIELFHNPWNPYSSMKGASALVVTVIGFCFLLFHRALTDMPKIPVGGTRKGS